MASLTETSYLARKGVNIFIIFVISFIILRFTWIVAGDLITKYFPKSSPPATCYFGPLPRLNAQNNIASGSALTVSQDAVDVPQIPPSLTVYFISEPQISFKSLEKMKSIAASLGFTSEPRRQSGNLWKFVDSANPLRTLEIDQISGNFHLKYDFSSDVSVFDGKNFSQNGSPVDSTLKFFESAGLLTDELKSGTPQMTYLKLANNTFVPATSLSGADAIAVTINRANIGDFKVFSPDATMGLVSVLFSGSSDPNKKILEANYYFRPVSVQNSATYPAVSLAEAIGQLESGRAIIASIPNPPTKTFNIQTISLGYLDPFPAQPYLQPVLAFSDGKGFVAYVPAVKSDCSKK